MKFGDFFKKKKPETKPASAKATLGRSPATGEAARQEKPVEKKKVVETKSRTVKPKKVLGTAYKVLKTPHVTEKATDLIAQNHYVFKVWPRANKKEIKKAVEETYGVDVLGVNIINVAGKKKRLGKTTGWGKGYKKAIVKVKKDQKIEVLQR